VERVVVLGLLDEGMDNVEVSLEMERKLWMVSLGWGYLGCVHRLHLRLPPLG
jgi:hypothetical protein